MGKKGAQALSRNPNWKGGRTVASSGYVLIKQPNHPHADIRGYIYEHRLVAEQVIGRPLHSHEQVHHKNGIKTDNRAENLEVVPSRAHHMVRHRKPGSRLKLPDEPNPLIHCQCGCGTTLHRFDTMGRPRSYVSGHNQRTKLGRFAA